MKLPTFQSHKQVQAAPIVFVDQPSCQVHVATGTGTPAVIDVPAGFFARTVPAVGDYLVVYRDGYVSHCPRVEFEDGYALVGDRMDFGAAILALKAGYRVAREGWNGKGMWLKLILPGDYQIHREIDVALYDARLLAWIGMKTADDKFVPWLASQTDMLAEDWCVGET